MNTDGKNHKQNFSKLYLKIYKKDTTQRPSVVYPRNARIV